MQFMHAHIHAFLWRLQDKLIWAAKRRLLNFMCEWILVVFGVKLKHLFRVCCIVSLLLEIWEVKAISLDLHATIYITINNFVRESSKNDDNTNTVKANAYFFLKHKTCFLLDISPENIANRTKEHVLFRAFLLVVDWKNVFFAQLHYTVVQHINKLVVNFM